MKRPTNSVNTQHTSQQITEQPQKTHKKKCHSSILSYPQLTDPHFSFNLTSSPRSCWTLAWRWRGWNTWMEEYHQQMNKHCKMDVHIYMCYCMFLISYMYSYKGNISFFCVIVDLCWGIFIIHMVVRKYINDIWKYVYLYVLVMM